MSVDKNNTIELVNVSKSFLVAGQNVPVLNNIDLKITNQEFLIIFGPSGSGKSTLLHILLGLETPTQGKVKVLGTDIYSNFSSDDQARFRKQNLGIVYQQPYWIKALNVLENVAFPLYLLGEKEEVAQNKALEMLKMVEMEDWKNYFPGELSSGQQQRISLARALISNPQLIVADEPTGNLDYDSGLVLMQLLSKIHKETKKTIIMVTHDLEYMTFATKALRIKKGKIDQQLDKKAALNYLEDIQSKRKKVHDQI